VEFRALFHGREWARTVDTASPNCKRLN
jgi:hypothetical protein